MYVGESRHSSVCLCLSPRARANGCVKWQFFVPRTRDRESCLRATHESIDRRLISLFIDPYPTLNDAAYHLASKLHSRNSTRFPFAGLHNRTYRPI